MTKIYLVRHAEAEGNLYRLVQGHFDGLVTKLGYDQIRALRRRFENIPIDAVYSSDLFRARTTARAVSEPRNLPILLREDLREVHLGWWEGHPWQEANVHDHEMLTNFHRDLSKLHVRGGESAADARDRMLSAIRDIAAQNEGKTVAVFSHGLAIRILLGTLRGLALSAIDQTVLCDNTGVSLLEVENGEIREIFGGDNSHLTEAGLTKFVPRKPGHGPGRFEDGISYRSADEASAAVLSAAGYPVPAEGETLVVYQGAEAAGMVQLLGREGDTGLVGRYGLLPAYRGRGRGIQPMGQAVMHYRAEGCTGLRLVDVPQELRAYFARYGFEETKNNAMELSIGYEDREL